MVLKKYKTSVYMLPMFLLAIFSVLTFGTTSVFADGGVSTGVDSILRSSSLEGADNFRSTIAGYLHRPIAFIITIAGFLIITFSFLKVVLTLLYLTFPDIFDKIDAHQKQSLQVNLREASPIDMISYVFALIMPNIKSLTDYSQEDNQLDVTPMDYLKKKLPIVIFFIIIGAMIYDGQARNFIAKAADVGMFFGGIIERHDTVGAVRNFIDDSDRYVFAYNSSTQEGKNQHKIAQSVQRALHGINPGLRSNEHADEVGKEAEKIVTQIVDEMKAAGQKANIADFGDIVSFNISVAARATQPSTEMGSNSGSGVMQYTINNDKVLEGSNKKYLVIRYSQIVDKDNRNILFEAPKATEAPGK